MFNKKLTYASQMTGWQSEYSNVQSLHQEAMELTRTVSHLAAANQQLATAHSALLSQVEILYMEINKKHEINRNKNKHDEHLNNRVEIIEDIIKKNKIDENNLQYNDDLKNDYDNAMEKIKILESQINESKIYDKNNINNNIDDDLTDEMKKIKQQNLELHEIIEKLKIDFDIVQKNYEVFN